MAEENRRLEAHVKQLKCIIAKLQSEATDKKKGKQKPQRPFDFSKYVQIQNLQTMNIFVHK